MNVQRDLISLDNSNLSAEMGLDIPVPIGKSFVISSVRASAYEWVSPDDYDLASGWQNPMYAYDNNTNTYAQTSGNGYLELLMPLTVACDTLRFRGKYTLSGGGLGTANVYLDTYHDSVWGNVYSGAIANDQWVETTTNQDIEKVRIKFNNNFGICESGYISEVQLNDVQIETLSKALCKVELTTISGGCFTEVKATRAEAMSGCVVSVEWQAIYGDEFTVQSGVINCDDELTTVSAMISPIDLDSSFVVHTNFTNQEYGTRGLFASTLASGEITFIRFAGVLGDVNEINWYVVTWSGASVQHQMATLNSNTVTVDINTIDRTKAFLLYSYLSESESADDALFSRGIISSNSEVTFATYQDLENQYIGFFVVEHPDLYVQYGTVTISGASETITLMQVVNVDKTFLPTPQIGNAYSDIGIDGTLYWCYNTHKLFQDGTNSKITIERSDEYGNIYASWFAVGHVFNIATVSTLSCTDIQLSSFKTNGNITDDGNMSITRRGFCYKKSMFGNPTIDDYVVYEDGTFGTGSYSLDVTGVNPSTTFRVRAYAINLNGIAYGNTVDCETDSIFLSEFCGTEFDVIGFVNKFKTPRI